MPVIHPSSYTSPPFLQFNSHLQSIVPSFRKVKGVIEQYKRERITTTDDDFLDLDWIKNNNNKLVVLTHGLEGSSQRPYILGMAKIFSENGWDVLAWNCRSCSGELNRQFRMYNHGDIDDITTVVEHATQNADYQEVVMIGFSMGSNLSLKYAALNRHPSVTKVVAFSAPLDMRSSIAVMLNPENWLYKKYFIKNLMPKVEAKAKLFPDKLDYNEIKNNRDWWFQVHTFFCKINGYESMDDFYLKGSAINFLNKIKIPALIVQADNDPMLTPECIPTGFIKSLDNIFLEVPLHGGHCGFIMRGDLHSSWGERRAFEFVTSESVHDINNISNIRIRMDG